MFNRPYKPVKIYRWLSETKKIIYVFDNYNEYDNGDEEVIIIKETLYTDDTIENTLNKIAVYLKKYDDTVIYPIYSWANNKSLLFDIEKILWDGYNINPFKSTNRKSKDINEPISYNYKINEIFDYNKINITFSNDIKEFKDNKYYFIDTKLPKYNALKLLDTKLKNLIDIPNNTKLVSEIYNRVDLQDKIKKDILLSSIFDILQTSKYISLIQYINDNSKILYKLYKKHNIKTQLLLNILNIDKIIKTNCINIYSILDNGSYCKINIDNDNNILFNYIIDLRKSINWKQINENKTHLIKILENTIKQPINLKEISLKLNVFIEIDNSSISVLSKKIGEYINIFNVIKLLSEKDKNKIICVYKRSSNYNKEAININEYIKSRFNIGISPDEIIQELINLGISKEDAESNVSDEIYNINIEDTVKNNKSDKLKKPTNITNSGTLVIIEQYNEGYLINITNIVNKKELNNLLYWLSKIISSTRDTNKKTKITINKDIKKYEDIENKKSLENEDSDDSDEDNLGAEEYNLDGGAIGKAKGGAIGKDKHSYFVNMLQNADKNLFGDNYAREKCQASNQPIVISKEKKEELEKNKKAFFDNIIEYGSEKNISNYYACPRLWCPQSKIPLDINDDDAKCPIENEEPMKLFWDKDKNKERYVKLIKQNDKGICVPCCFKKKPKEEEIEKCKKFLKSDSKKIEIISKTDNKNSLQQDDNYIMNQPAPLLVNRYGNIPETLHNLLLPNISFELCSKTLNKSNKCLVRKGINHRNIDKFNIKNDSILYSIANALDFDNKKSLIKDIKNKLDLVSFMSLENGEVCKAFINIDAILPEDNKDICKKLKLYLQKNKKIKNLFDIDNISSKDKFSCNNYTNNLSRLLNIFIGYNKFLDYLSDDNYPIEKNPNYLYSLVSTLYSKLLVIWEKIEKDKNINIICPYYASFEDMLSELELNPKAIMILKDGKYYEPLELKLRGENGEKSISINKFPKIKEIIKECNKYIKNNNNNYLMYQKLYTLYQWIETKILKNNNKFLFKTIFINNDLTIDTIMLYGNMLINIEPITIALLPKLILELKIKHVLFYDDIQKENIKYNINILSSDLNKFVKKIKELSNITINIGNVDNYKEGALEYYGILSLEEKNINGAMMIHTNIDNKLDNYIKDEKEYSNIWFKYQKLVAKTILNKYNNDKLDNLNKNNRLDKINILIKLFDFIKNKKDINIIRIILEEIPLYSINSINKWINDIIIFNKYNYYSDIIKENNKEFIFSQYSLLNNIPNKLIVYNKNIPTHNLNIKYNTNDFIFNKKIDMNKNSDIIPSLYTGYAEKLKTKWIINKKSYWNNMVILKNDKYDKNTIPEFYEWLSKIIGIKTNYNDVIDNTRQKYYNIMNNEKAMFILLSDPSFFNEITTLLNKSYKTVQTFWDNVYTKLSNKEKENYITTILNSNNLYPNDLNILSISELLNISILMIHRGTYGKFNENSEEIKRGELEDLVLSSTFFKANNNMTSRPLIILSKENSTNKTNYYAIINKASSIPTINDIYLVYKEVPENIKNLIYYHINSKK